MAPLFVSFGPPIVIVPAAVEAADAGAGSFGPPIVPAAVEGADAGAGTPLFVSFGPSIVPAAVEGADAGAGVDANHGLSVLRPVLLRTLCKDFNPFAPTPARCSPTPARCSLLVYLSSPRHFLSFLPHTSPTNYMKACARAGVQHS